MGMKITKKIVAAVLSGMMLCASAASVPAMAVSAEEAKYDYLFLGDSISTGAGLDYHSYCYTRQLDSKKTHSWAFNGFTTADVIERIQLPAAKRDIQNSKNIIITTGGNDLLQPVMAYVESKKQGDETLLQTLKRLAAEKGADVVLGDITKALSTPRTAAKSNIATIAATLTALNPDAKIVFQTIYNPFEVPESMVTERGFSKSDFTLLMNYINNNEKILNNAMKAQEQEYPNVLVADVSAAFAGTGWLYTNVMKNDVHPNALGQALIACTVMDTLGVEGKVSENLYHTLAMTSDSVLFQVPDDDMILLERYVKTPAPHDLGDIDGNGSIDTRDCMLALYEYTYSFIGLNSVLDPIEKKAADINNDGQIALFDTRAILRYYVYRSVSQHDNITWDDVLKAKD